MHEAQEVLQEAYDIDIGKRKGSIDSASVLKEIGAMGFHVSYYDSGLAQNEEIRQHIREFPDGQFVQLIRALRDTRAGEYDERTLDTMYGLNQQG